MARTGLDYTAARDDIHDTIPLMKNHDEIKAEIDSLPAAPQAPVARAGHYARLSTLEWVLADNPTPAEIKEKILHLRKHSPFAYAAPQAKHNAQLFALEWVLDGE